MFVGDKYIVKKSLWSLTLCTAEKTLNDQLCHPNVLDSNDPFRPVINTVREDPLINHGWMSYSTSRCLRWQRIFFQSTKQADRSEIQITHAA